MPPSNRTVYKYRRPVEETIVLDLPESARLLKVADQVGNGQMLDFWAIVPGAAAPPEPVRERVIRVHGTGHPIAPGELTGFEHWDSVVTAGGALVWHVFLDFNGSRTIPEGR